MRKIMVFIKREYRETVLKKSFIILTLLTPLLMLSFTILPTLLLKMESSQTQIINIYDAKGTIATDLTQTLNDTLNNGQHVFIFNILHTSLPDTALLKKQKELVRTEIIDGFLYIPEKALELNRVQFFTRNAADFDVIRRLSNSIENIVIEKRLINSGLNPDLIKELTREVSVQTIKISKSGQEKEAGFDTEYFSVFLFVLILYMTLIMYGTSIMRSIIQEKSNKVVEVILASARPIHLMGGKILGQGMVGLTQYALWSLIGLAITFFGSHFTAFDTGLIHFSASTLAWFVLFYILGYFLFSALYAIVGVASTTDQEAQQAAMPVTLLLVVPLLVLTMIVKNPDSTLVVALSFIPFFSPIVMFARIIIGGVPAWEIVLSVVLLLLTIALLISITAKVFRIGILMTGKRVTLPEILHWLRS